jgi:hypothetical protein
MWNYFSLTDLRFIQSSVVASCYVLPTPITQQLLLPDQNRQKFGQYCFIELLPTGKRAVLIENEQPVTLKM